MYVGNKEVSDVTLQSDTRSLVGVGGLIGTRGPPARHALIGSFTVRQRSNSRPVWLGEGGGTGALIRETEGKDCSS